MAQVYRGSVYMYIPLSEPICCQYAMAVLKAPYVVLDIDNPGVQACMCL